MLASERLILSAPAAADFDERAALWGDPFVTRFVGGRPSTAEEVWSRQLRYVGHWAVLGFGYWTVREKNGGGFVGDVGFADWRRELEPSFAGAPEAGWVLSAAMHGRGYATEAMRAALVWAEANLPGPRTVCMIDPGNAASIGVALKCGYAEYARADYHGSPSVLFERYQSSSSRS